MPMAELVDLEKEKARMEKELKKNSAELQKLETKLQNPGFVNKAPEHVVKARAGAGRPAAGPGGQAGGAAPGDVQNAGVPADALVSPLEFEIKKRWGAPHRFSFSKNLCRIKSA